MLFYSIVIILSNMINYMYFVHAYKIINNWKNQVVLKLANNIVIYYSANYTIIAQYTVQRIINAAGSCSDYINKLVCYHNCIRGIESSLFY